MASVALGTNPHASVWECLQQRCWLETYPSIASQMPLPNTALQIPAPFVDAICRRAWRTIAWTSSARCAQTCDAVSLFCKAERCRTTQQVPPRLQISVSDMLEVDPSSLANISNRLRGWSSAILACATDPEAESADLQCAIGWLESLSASLEPMALTRLEFFGNHGSQRRWRLTALK